MVAPLRPHLDAGGHLNIGRELRHRREALLGENQGALDVPAGTIVLCIGAGSVGDELAAEILVRILRQQGIDGRHMALDEFDGTPPDDFNPAVLALYCLVSIEPAKEQSQIAAALAALAGFLPDAEPLALLLASPFEQLVLQDSDAGGGRAVARSFEAAAQACQRVLRGKKRA
ncbi:hypothetical protein [Rugamonas sp. DEMB1]|uniref:hypothetical protein n=1 Tax=Rugamonas sp. DEMB1 TaxID=3039386 RepID=UPI002448DC4D|nr:hypothetical protein [Rugamonas sp. DEMB1]WGG52330.1 hypothetical protein QC826_09370 [Rugamonas sp. DEMB1]